MNTFQAIVNAPAQLLDELQARDDVTIRLCHQDEHSGFQDHEENVALILVAFAKYTHGPTPDSRAAERLSISQKADMIEAVAQFSDWLEDGQLNDEAVYQLGAIRPPIL